MLDSSEPLTPNAEQARALIERAHAEWSRGNLDGMVAQFTVDMEFWCNAGDPAVGPIEFKGRDAFRQSLEAVLRTTRSKSQLLSFRFDGKIAHARARIRMRSLVSGAQLDADYRQIITYRGLRISRIEEFHDAARLTAFWRLHSEGAKSGQAVWDVDPLPDDVKKF